MRPVSEAFLAAVTGSHSMTARARVVTTYQEGIDPDGVEIEIKGGSVSGDATAAIRHELDLTTPGHGWDTDPSGLLTPYGNECYVERGVVAGGVIQWVGLGYYRMYEAAQDDGPDGTVGITGKDRMSGIIDARLEAPVQYLSSNTVGFVFNDLVTAVYPDATVSFDDDTDSAALGRSVVVERDRYEFLRDLAAAQGKVFYVRYDGVFRVESPPDPDEPVVTLAGGRGGVLLQLSTELYREGVYNIVVAQGEGTDETPPVRAVARDNNPESPTYWAGRYGPVPRFYTSQMLTTAVQAQRAAESILRQNLGLPYTADLSAVPNPALEVLDPISVRAKDSAEQRIYVIKDLSIPLTADGAMSASMTQQVGYVPGEDEEVE